MPTRDRTNDTDDALAVSLTIYRRLVASSFQHTAAAREEFRETLRQLEAETERRQLAQVCGAGGSLNHREVRRV